jgi:two-component system sensor kinase FixL
MGDQTTSPVHSSDVIRTGVDHHPDAASDSLRPTLETITRAAQVLAGQISADGIATALLNAGMALSGSQRGVVVLAAVGALTVENGVLLLGPADLVRARPSISAAGLPSELWLAAVTERSPQIHLHGDRPTAFPIEPGASKTVSALCTPILSHDVVNGFLYLEFDEDLAQAASRKLAALTLLATQAGMTLKATRGFATQTNDPLWRARSQTANKVATFRWNPRTRLATGSPEYYEILGFDPAMGPIGYSDMTSRLHPADYPYAQTAVNECVRLRTPLRQEFRVVLPSGEVRHLLWSGQFDPLHADSPELEGIVMDITDLKAADDVLRAAQDDAERRMRLAWMGELAGSIVHEINQPLGAILSNAEAALRWLDRDIPDFVAAKQSIENIRMTAQNAGRTVANMRALSANSAPEITNRPINAIVSEALQLSNPLIRRAKVLVHVSFDPNNPFVRCDSGQVLQVMHNLVRNAVDSLRDIHGRDRTLTIRTSVQSDNFVTAEVEDSGAGLAPDAAKRLFDPLYTTKRDGMGLGLSICRRIIDAHMGTIAARSNPEFGTTFTVTLPGADEQVASLRPN